MNSMVPSASTALAVVLAIVSFSRPAGAALSFIGNAYAELKPSGGDNTYYWVNQSDSVNPQFSDDLNGLTIHVGDSLLLGGQVQTWEPQQGVTVTLEYKIDNGSFNALNLPYFQTANNNDWWEQTPDVDIAAGLSAGTHTLTLYYWATTGGTTIFDNAGGANFSANFSVVPVPEPVNMALGILGVLGLGGAALKKKLKR